MPAVAIGVVQNDDAIPELCFVRPATVGVVLSDPQPATVIELHIDRLLHIRFPGKQRHRETLGQLNQRQHLCRCRRMRIRRIRIECSRKVIRSLQERHAEKEKTQHEAAPGGI